MCGGDSGASGADSGASGPGGRAGGVGSPGVGGGFGGGRSGVGGNPGGGNKGNGSFRSDVFAGGPGSFGRFLDFVAEGEANANPFVAPDILPPAVSQSTLLPASFGRSPGFTQGVQGADLQPIGLPSVSQNPVVSNAPFTQQGSDQSGRVILNALGTLAQQSGVNLGF